MGEYAIRKSDNSEIKIGTCEEMFYLRWDDLEKIQPLKGNVTGRENGLYFRLPFPDEDSIEPGDYENHARGQRLYSRTLIRGDGSEQAPFDYRYDDYSNPKLAENPGNIQLTHKSGLLLNVPCYHGERLPDLQGAKAFWNGKSHSYELTSVKTTPEGLRPIVSCRHCRQAWSFEWSDLWDFIPADMQTRLLERGYRQAA